MGGGEGGSGFQLISALVYHAAVFSLVTQRSTSLKEALRNEGTDDYIFPRKKLIYFLPLSLEKKGSYEPEVVAF